MSRTIKITTLDQAEELINRQNQQINQLQTKLNSVATEARNQMNNELAKRLNQLRTEQAAREKQIIDDLRKNTQTEIGKLDLKHKEALEKQKKQFYETVEQQSRDFTQKLNKQGDEFQKQLKEQKKETNKQFADVREQIQQQGRKLQAEIGRVAQETKQIINDLDAKVEKQFEVQQKQINDIRTEINEERQKENYAAQVFKNECQRIMNNASDNPSIQKFFPDALYALQRNFNTQIGSIGDFSQAVIANATNLITEVWDLEEKAQKQQLLFDLIHATTLEAAESLLRLMQRNRTETYFLDEKGEAIKDEHGNQIKVEIDYWTEGEFSAIEKRVEDLKNQLQENKDSSVLTTEKVNEILAEIKILEARQNELVTFAANTGLLSEERLYLSENIVNALLNRGFWLVKDKDGELAHNYMGREEGSTDTREGVYAVLENGDGVNITVVVNADNKVVFHRNDKNKDNPDMLKSTISFIRAAIEEAGYKMGDVAPPAETGDTFQKDLADADALKRRGIKGRQFSSKN